MKDYTINANSNWLMPELKVDFTGSFTPPIFVPFLLNVGFEGGLCSIPKILKACLYFHDSVMARKVGGKSLRLG